MANPGLAYSYGILCVAHVILNATPSWLPSYNITQVFKSTRLTTPLNKTGNSLTASTEQMISYNYIFLSLFLG